MDDLGDPARRLWDVVFLLDLLEGIAGACADVEQGANPDPRAALNFIHTEARRGLQAVSRPETE